MVSGEAFAAPCSTLSCSVFRGQTAKLCSRRTNPNAITRRFYDRTRCQPRAEATVPSPEDPAHEEQAKAVEEMRSRLEGLFGGAEEDDSNERSGNFDGVALRSAVRERWGVEYDVQPQKRNGRVYVQVMWRYFEQQSFYMGEDDFASHCEAVAQLLQKWDAVEYFCDYIATIKKRPVVGITINIPIPGVSAESVSFD